MAKYRKLPVEIEAFKYDGDLLNRNFVYYVPVWVVEAFEKGVLFYSLFENNPAELFIKTLEGNMHVSVDDYVIKGVNDEIYPCKPDIFEKTYKLVQ